ncbi:MAG: sugar phosphate isomerase/epimerase family protein [Oscillospiraceae bacterium]
MKLAFSNIGWEAADDERVYSALAAHGFTGLEIAPTRLVGDMPYDNIPKARDCAEAAARDYGLEICSMQSIWYGKSECICGSDSERSSLCNYTKRAVDFAKALACRNLVFGCPKNRSIPNGTSEGVALSFFKDICTYAAANGCVIGIEANPPIYNTNFLNTTDEAARFVKSVGEGAGINLDFGTILCNGESLIAACNNVHLISHVHISEPNLAAIEKRSEHRELASMLRESGYDRFVSVEMRCRPFDDVVATMDYISEVFA